MAHEPMPMPETETEVATPALTAVPDSAGGAGGKDTAPAPDEAALQAVMADPDYTNRTDNPARHQQLVKRALALRQTMLGEPAEGESGEGASDGDSTAREAAPTPVPASAGLYELPRPDVGEDGFFDETLEATARGWFHELGLSQADARTAWDRFHAHSMKVETSDPDAMARKRAEAEQTLRREWGEQYDAKVRRAEALVRSVGGERLVTLLEETGAGNDPALVRLAARLADRDVADLSDERAAIELTRLMGETAYLNRDHPDHKALVDRVYRIHGRGDG